MLASLESDALQPVAAMPSFDKLPNELVLLLAEQIMSEHDLNSLCQVNSRYYNLINPYLRRFHVDVSRSVVGLSYAVMDNSLTAVRAWLAMDGIHVNGGWDEPVPLILASRHEDLEIFRLLLAHPQIDPSYNPEEQPCPLAVAARDGNVEAVRILLSHERIKPSLCDVWGKTPLMCAAGRLQNFEVVKLLLDDGRSDINATNDNGVTAMHIAAGVGDRETIMLLWERGADPMARTAVGVTPLGYAVAKHRVEGVSALLAIPEVNPNTENRHGGCPLLDAVTIDPRVPILKMLLADERIDPNFHTRGGLPLVTASSMGLHDSMRQLLAHKDINVNALGCGELPLCEAIKSTIWGTTEILLADHRIDPLAVDGNGHVQSMELQCSAPTTKAN
ncbi:unnamed protein product [Parascedosporium putredinis]|uniref:Ankyrin repeat protein n=1 Tax=Parascedosporium putredinis TaxID=1442378 RepID=A0A9P1MA98_9PEZI|nr:unnamed protein product [Parascedosporium putredinis]CAI7993646.1 unnamed protein product [Parascedosporium putredinis]